MKSFGASCWGGFVLTMIGCNVAQAHVASNSFLTARVNGQEVTGSLELAVRDVELSVGVDANRDGKVTWGELRAAEPLLRRYLKDHLSFSGGGEDCRVTFQTLEVNDRVDGSYAWLPFGAVCSSTIKELQIRYTVMEGIDPSHRGLLTLAAGDTVQSAVLGGGSVQRSQSDCWRG